MANYNQSKPNIGNRRTSEFRRPTRAAGGVQRRMRELMLRAAHQEQLRKQAMATGDPIAHEENRVDGVQIIREFSYLVARQDLCRDKDGNCALDVQIYPEWPDVLRVMGDEEPYLCRETIHISEEAAEKWRRQNEGVKQRIAAGKMDRTQDASETIFFLPEEESLPDTYVIGRAFKPIGSLSSQECLFARKDKSFYLELTYFITGLGLGPENEPYTIKKTVPLTEKAADLWVQLTGAPDNAPMMYRMMFRGLFTSLPPCDIQ